MEIRTRTVTKLVEQEVEISEFVLTEKEAFAFRRFMGQTNGDKRISATVDNGHSRQYNEKDDL